VILFAASIRVCPIAAIVSWAWVLTIRKQRAQAEETLHGPEALFDSEPALGDTLFCQVHEPRRLARAPLRVELRLRFEQRVQPGPVDPIRPLDQRMVHIDETPKGRLEQPIGLLGRAVGAASSGLSIICGSHTPAGKQKLQDFAPTIAKILQKYIGKLS